MGIINVLDKHTANLIAAGEVVERPASAVKEMLENCADAGADTVTVEIKDGGTSFIRISDNGCGIAKEDVPKTILRHATSKIKTGSDLDAIGTLGFRGEALAAITAVSEVRILTKRPCDESGTVLECSFGEVISCEDAGCPDGTTIIVENIFENTPARRKFLKKNSTEASAVFAVCEKFALSRPEISIKFINDGAVKLQTPGDGKLINAIYSAIGRDFANALLPIDYELGGVRVSGYIGKPETCRPNRNMQNFFVNGRYIKSRTMLASLEEGFRGFCPIGKFPACVIFLEIALNLVDVNIHPAKLEIKFSDERKIFDCIYFSVKNALSKGISHNFTFSPPQDTVSKNYLPEDDAPPKPVPVQPSIPKQNLTDAEATAQKDISEIGSAVKNEPKNEPELEANLGGQEKCTPKSRTADIHPQSKSKPFTQNKADFEQPASPNVPIRAEEAPLPDNPPPIFENTAHTQPENGIKSENAGNLTDGLKYTDVEKPMFIEPEKRPIEKQTAYVQQEIVSAKNMITARYVGELFNTYIVVERGNSMYLIDKHAAHERIIYEKIKHSSDNNEAQYLLVPIPVALTPKEYGAVSAGTEYFAKIGFDFEEFGGDSVILRSVPAIIDISDAGDIFTFLAGKLADGNMRSAGEIFDRALYTAACKAAIKAGNKFTDEDNKFIIKEIFENDAVLYCPHGRPVLTEFSKEKIEKMFGRL